jgi:hypothetical protein
VLGSATPSLETWHRVTQGRYRRLPLLARIGGGAMPRVRLLDMGLLPKPPGGERVLAPALVDAIEQRIARGEQSLLLLNRRGYAPVLQCGACGWKSGCPHCSAWRVFHKGDRTLRCHHCGYTERVPRACPDCGNLDIAPVGRGTEKLAEQIGALLPQARVARIDADTTRGAGMLEQQLAAMHAGEVDVLVGTQMVAKGHDFRRVTLVAAVNPDTGLFSSDFRAPERLFALLMQAAGRAGRDAAQAAASEMWVQTWNPGHPLYAVDEELVEDQRVGLFAQAPEDHQHDDLQVVEVDRAAADRGGAVDHHLAHRRLHHAGGFEEGDEADRGLAEQFAFGVGVDAHAARALAAGDGLGAVGQAVEPAQRFLDLVGLETDRDSLRRQLLLVRASIRAPVVLVEVHEHIEHRSTIPQWLGRPGTAARAP